MPAGGPVATPPGAKALLEDMIDTVEDDAVGIK